MIRKMFRWGCRSSPTAVISLVLLLGVIPFKASSFSVFRTGRASFPFSTATSNVFAYHPGCHHKRYFGSLFTHGAIFEEGDDISTVDSLIIGGGPAGLLTAIMLSQRNAQKSNRELPTKKVIHVYERLSPPPSINDRDDGISNTCLDEWQKSYRIGLGERGQAALRRFGVWSDIEPHCIPILGRCDWITQTNQKSVDHNDNSGTTDDDNGMGDASVTIFGKEKPISTQVLSRDQLVASLRHHIDDHYSDMVAIHDQAAVVPIDFEHSDVTSTARKLKKGVLVGVAKRTSEESGDFDYCVQANFVVAADGAGRTVANKMEELDKAKMDLLPVWQRWRQRPFRIYRYPDDNPRVYKTIPLQLPDSWRWDLNYGGRTEDGRLVWDALPVNREGTYCVTLLLRESDILARFHHLENVNTNVTDEIQQSLSASLPAGVQQLIESGGFDVWKHIATSPAYHLPEFAVAESRIYQGDHTLLLGDCAHSVKPYFGMGANTALEDVVKLSDTLDRNIGEHDEDEISTAIRIFSKEQGPQFRHLVRMSRELDRPGFVGFISGIGPLILDAIFQRIPLMRVAFKPNVIAMLQKEGWTFRQVARRKRFDRVGQLLVLTCAGLIVEETIQWGVRGITAVAP